MKNRGLYRLFSFIASIGLLFNSLVYPFVIAYAQEASPSPEPIPTIEESTSPEPTILPIEEPIGSPTPTIEPTILLNEEPILTPVPSEEPTITPAPLEEQFLAETPNSESYDTSESDVAEVSAQLVEEQQPELEKVCLIDETIIDSENENWNINQTDGYAETKEKVQLGVKYIFPLDNKVTLTFKCLPKDKSLRTSLKIKQVKVADLDLPGDFKTDSEYAFDITTDMKNGEFEFDLTLPKPEGVEVDVAYIEKTVEEAKKGLEEGDVKKVEEDKIKQNGEDNDVKVKELNHMTIYYSIDTYKSNTFSVSKDEYLQSETVYAKATRNYSAYMRIRLLDPSDNVKKVCDYDYGKSVTCEYELPLTAALGEWTAQIGRCNSGCDKDRNWSWSTRCCGGHPYGEAKFDVLEGVCVPTTTMYEKSGDYDDSKVNIDRSYNWEKISVNAKSGYEIDNVWLDVTDDGTYGYVWAFSGSRNNHNPPGRWIQKAKVEVTRVCPTVCGNDIKEDTEQCDGTDLGGLSPSDFSCSSICELELVNNSVTICHATNADVNPYNLISPNIQNNGDLTGGHLNHTGGIYPEDGWGDIIPPYVYIGGSYPGMNWTTEGREIWNNDCEIIAGSLQVNKEVDTDGDGIYETFDPGANALGFRWGYNDETPAREMSTQIDLPYETYMVSESYVTDYDFTGWYSKENQEVHSCQNPEGTDYPVSVTVDEESVAIVLCNAIDTGSIIGTKYHDLNNNGTRDTIEGTDELEPGLSGWEITLLDSNENSIDQITTDENGNYFFNNLPVGGYGVCETQQTGWEMTEPNFGGGCRDIFVTEDSQVTANFGNRQIGKIKVCKVIANPNGDIVNGSDVAGSSFSISGWEGTIPSGKTTSDGLIPTSDFTTALNFNADVFSSMSGDDAQCITYENLPLGNYFYLDESIPSSGWEKPKYNDQFKTPVSDLSTFYEFSGQLFDTNLSNDEERNKDADGHIVLSKSRPERTLVILNQYKPTTIEARKIVCDDEADLPDWGNGAANINASTATDWVANHGSCQLVDDWYFEWGPKNAGNPGDTWTGPAGGSWVTFGPTVAGVSTAVIDDLSSLNGRLELREVLQENYVPFTYLTNGKSNVDNRSAEFYCASDVKNYDNYEWIKNPKYGHTYYCVAFNALNTGSISGYKWEDVNGNGIWEDTQEFGKEGWTIFIDENGNGFLDLNEVSSTLTDGNGYYQFADLIVGDYSVCEVENEDYVRTLPSGSNCQTVNVLAGEDSAHNDFANQLIELGINLQKANTISDLTVTYTLTVTNIGNQDFDPVEVIDALPGGFSYIAGSSYLDGISISDPTESGGVLSWDIGFLAKDDSVELTFEALIDGDVPEGVYTNQAYANGWFYYTSCSDGLFTDTLQTFKFIEEQLPSCSEKNKNEESAISSSSIAMVKDIDLSGSLTPQVLGISTVLGDSTELPATGNPTKILILAGIMGLFGIGLKIYERKKYEKN